MMSRKDGADCRIITRWAISLMELIGQATEPWNTAMMIGVLHR